MVLVGVSLEVLPSVVQVKGLELAPLQPDIGEEVEEGGLHVALVIPHHCGCPLGSVRWGTR